MARFDLQTQDFFTYDPCIDNADQLHSGGSRPDNSSIQARVTEFENLIREQDGIQELLFAIEENLCARDKVFLSSRTLTEKLHRIRGELRENDTIIETMADPKREPGWQIAN
jgi:hypothetical protein